MGSPTGLQFGGPATTIQAGACAIFQIRSVDSSGSPSSVLSDTYLNASGTGSGKFYQDEHCSTPVSFTALSATPELLPWNRNSDGRVRPSLFRDRIDLRFMDPTAGDPEHYDQ